MIIAFHDHAWDDYLSWDAKTQKKINRLIEEIRRTPIEGTGQPEPLKYQLQGYWSRRITQEHRLVYKVTDEMVIIAQTHYHY